MPSSWSQWETAVYRACGRCVYGRTDDGRLARNVNASAAHCACPAVTGGRGPVSVTAARANSGPCGPEAHHQDFPGLVMVSRA
jgi:hypothetical protein